MSPSTSAPARRVDANLPARLRMAVMRLSRRLRQEAEGDVTASQLAALSSIERLGPLTLGELAGVERVKPPTMTKIVVALEELGFVVREPDAVDRRVTRVRVSDIGRRHVAASRTRLNVYLAQRLRRFTADELDVLERAVPLIERLIEEEQRP